MAGTCTLALAFWIGWAPVAALMLGYASHLLGDSATKSGLRLRYPNARRYHLLPSGWRITTGSQAEDLVAALLLLPALLLFFQQMVMQCQWL